ncbi:MAG TPA: M50 family metallopeptidase [Euzebyales bacterium]|nr:M50 family metallopeptidase [Euzebyales bacterium]
MQYALAWAPVIVALALVVARRPWRLLRPVVTIAHEGGHVAVALLAGRRLAGMRVHADASGIARSRGRSRGLGMVVTLLAGYVTPCLLGLGAAALVAADQHQLILSCSIALLAALLVTVRNVFGAVAIVLTGAVLLAVAVYASPPLQEAGASLLAWFLLFGGLRSVSDMRRGRRGGRGRDTDADQLARATRVPAVVWVLAFTLVAVGTLAAATALLVTA